MFHPLIKRLSKPGGTVRGVTFVFQLIQDDGSWVEAAAATTGDDAGTGGQEARLEQLHQRAQR